MAVTPKWGQSGVVPEDAIAAWGARLIVDQDGMVDMLGDRQGTDDGPHADELLQHLNGPVLRGTMETIGDLLRGSVFEDEWVQMSTREREDFIVYQDDRLCIHANTNGSAGYCYVTAWLYSVEEPTQSGEWCEMVPDGTDADGTEWNRCIIHGHLVLGDVYVCEGYRAPDYVEPEHYRDTFTTPFEQHADRRGQGFRVLRVITEPDETHDAEVLPMYRIRFEDGFEIDAWPEEVLANG